MEKKVFVIEWISQVETSMANREKYWNVKLQDEDGLTWFSQLEDFRKD